MPTSSVLSTLHPRISRNCLVFIFVVYCYLFQSILCDFSTVCCRFQVCMRGRVHIFKYLENMANKDTLPHRRVDETRRSAKHSSFLNNTPNQGAIISGNATIDCLRHKPRHVVDSGYCTDGVEKRWSNDGEFS